ncbi:hypothetical protein [Aquibacillus saliphilus]|uniref:hypothetical protein n=1 Tax=Aquibacillus saliphilus TaxID=1909422 RepID=UPI001CF0BE89|nr:hypothetical protein [Aquibacillus saliphilus]
MQDELSKEDLKQDPKSVTFAQLSKLLFNDIEKSTSKSTLTKKYTKEQIIGFLDNPQKNQKQLRDLSNYLYNTNANYRRLILYFSNLLTFDYVVDSADDLDKDKVELDKFKKQYSQAIQQLENMNISHEMLKVLKTSFKEDVFYGYEYSTFESYFIQKLNPNYCRVSGFEDGVYTFEFDFSYFDNKDISVESYAQEFQNKYKLYQKNKKNRRWQEIDARNSICIKINEEVEYPLPPFNTVFESVYDIDETKRMRVIKNKMDNYMLLTQLIPVDESSGEPNNFAIDLDTAISFHNKAIQSLPEEVGLVTSPMKIDAIKLENKNKDSDVVAEATRDYFNDTGVSQYLFNSDKASNSSISKSIITDEQIVFGVLRQIERWVNRKLKFSNNKYKFKVEFLDTTIFNKEEVQDRYLKAAQSGMPVIQEYAASLGLSPSALTSKLTLQNDILDLHSKLTPLASSHTQSGKDSSGRPSKSDDELGEEGSKTREGDKNDN